MNGSNLKVLNVVFRARKVETDTARRALGDASGHETALAAREMDAARGVPGDFDRDAFVAWFRRMRALRDQLAETMREAAARTETARTDLARRRLAETAAEEAVARAVAEHAAVAQHRDQVILEDVARALKRINDG